MDQIRVGLDFGTHQTKICVQRIPDEGHGQPIYEFFSFEDLNGEKQYFLPSLVQVNKDDTLSYGYVDSSKEKGKIGIEPLHKEELMDEVNVSKEAAALYVKYSTPKDNYEDIRILVDMLMLHQKNIKQSNKNIQQKNESEYNLKLKEFNKSRYVYRYFKQATFAKRPWDKDISSKTLSIWYLSYVLFCLDKKYGMNYSINMGVPADNDSIDEKRKLAVEILLSAFHLVEDVYDHDMDAFLAEKIDQLKEKTSIIPYSPEMKDEYIINVFPEAYAGLITLTSKGKISTGMSLTVDIGGGTTDISFFTIQKNEPMIFRYWSIPRGLNYIAEESGFDYFSMDNFSAKAKPEIIEKFKRKELEMVTILIKDLEKQLKKETNIPIKALHKALKDRVVVYNGGGSTHKILTNGIGYFTDVKLIMSDMWKEENIVDKKKVGPLCQLLTTAYGLSLGESDKDVNICYFTDLFKGLSSDNNRDTSDNYVDKDRC